MWLLAALAWPGAAVAQDARATLEATIGFDAIPDEVDTFRGSGLGFGVLLGIAFDDDFEGGASGTRLGVRLGVGILIF